MKANLLPFLLLSACLPEMPDSPALDAGIGLPTPDAGRTVSPPPPVPDAGPRDVGFGELSLIGVRPARGPITGGTRVQLRGAGFLPDTQVELGGQPVRDVLVVSSRVLTFFTPASSLGLADLRVQNAFGNAELTQAFTYFQPLQPLHISPIQGPLEGGNELRLSGEGLSAETLLLFNGRALQNSRMEDGDLVGFVPPGLAAGVIDLRIADAFDQVYWRAAYTYLAKPYIESFEPLRAQRGEAVEIRIDGAFFCSSPEVSIGGLACPMIEGDGQTLRCNWQAPDREGMQQVEVVCPWGEAQKAPGLAVLDAQGAPVLLGVDPDQGPLAGGGQVTLIGRQLPNDQLLWNGQPIAVALASDRGLRVLAPTVESPVAVDVSAGDAGLLRQAYRYQDPLILRGVEPPRGPSGGGDTVRVFGDGFCPQVRVFFGSVEQQVLEVETRQITLRSEAHSGGFVPVEIRCGERRARRLRGYFFQAPLSYIGLSPNRGALAGGTEIFIVGKGLGRQGLQATLGGLELVDVDVISDSLLRAKTPPGISASSVDLQLQLADESVLGGSAFTYYEPGFRYGGSRGGSPRGSVNITVLNTWANLSPIEGVNVVVGGTTFEQRIVGQTDARGQVTLSDPSLFGPQTVTVYKDGCDRTRTMVDIDAADLTFWLGCRVEIPPGEGGGGGTPPPAPQPMIVSGRITNFSKALFDPGTLGPDERAFAQVHLTQSMPYGAGQWLRGQDFVFEDGGEYRVSLPSGRYTLVAVAGVHNSRTQQVIRLTQLGFLRGVTGPAGERLVDQDIELNYPMDAVYGVNLGDRPSPIPGMYGGDRMRVRVALDFGGEGYFPLADEMSRGSFIVLRGLPRVAADLLYISGGLVTGDGGASPSSTIRLRGNGRLEGGITLGPLLPFAERLAPRRDGGLIADRVLRWKFAAGPLQPDYIWVDIGDEQGNTWELMLRGSQNKLRLPVLPHGVIGLGRPGLYHAQITAVANPRFNFDNFSYLDTWFMSWQALSERNVSFRLD